MYDKQFFLLLDEKLENILTKLPFTNEEIEQVQLYLDAAEYGLGFELLCYILENNKILISESIYNDVEELGTTMLFDAMTWEGLRPFVK